MATRSKLIRLTLDKAASEFAINARTLARAFAVSETQCGDDGCYSVLQVFKAISGDLEAHKIRETRHRANLLEIEEMEKIGTLIRADVFLNAARRGFQSITATIMSMTDLEIEKREEIINRVRECALALEAGGERDVSTTTALHNQPVV